MLWNVIKLLILVLICHLIVKVHISFLCDILCCIYRMQHIYIYFFTFSSRTICFYSDEQAKFVAMYFTFSCQQQDIKMNII